MNSQDTPEPTYQPYQPQPAFQEKAQDFLQEADRYIRANPGPAIFAALGVGFAIGLLSRFAEPASKREPWQDALDEMRGMLASGKKRGRKAYERSADAVREAVGQASEKVRDIDVDPVTSWWKKVWS